MSSRGDRGAPQTPGPPAELLDCDDRQLVRREDGDVGLKSHETFVPPVTVQSVYVVLDWTSFALTVVADAPSVKATLSMFAGLVVLSVYATPDTV